VTATSFFKQADSKKRVEQPQDRKKEDTEMSYDQNPYELNTKNSNV